MQSEPIRWSDLPHDDWTYPNLGTPLGELPVRTAIIDGGVASGDATGIPDFWPLLLRSATPARLRVRRSISWP